MPGGTKSPLSRWPIRWHDTPLLTDPALQEWLQAPGFCVDTMRLHAPAARLQLASMEEVAKLLVETRALEGARESI